MTAARSLRLSMPALLLTLAMLLAGLTGLAPAPAEAAPLFEAYHGKDGAYHQDRWDELSPKGYRPISLSIYGSAGKPLYAAVWVHRPGPAYVGFHGYTAAQYQAFHDTWTQDGYRPSIVTATGSGSSARFAGVFELSPEPALAKHGIDADEFAEWTTWARDNDYILRWASVYGSKNAPRYVGVWWPNTTGIAWNHSIGDDGDTYQEKFDAYVSTGVRPDLVTFAEAQRYLAIWHDNSIGPWKAYHGLTSKQYQDTVDELVPLGFFPFRVEGAGKGNAVRYAAIFARTDLPAPRFWQATGQAQAALLGFDGYMQQLMQANGIRAGALAVARDGKLAYARGFTWAEAGYPVTQPASLFRIASCAKPLTGIATMQIEEAFDLALTDTMQGFLGVEPPGGGAPVDSRWATVTVDDLLVHAGGWDRSLDGNMDPMFNDVNTVAAFSADLPATTGQIASFMAGQSLDFTPGTQSQYSNFGYSLLGRIIEQRTGLGYTEAVQAGVFAPLGVTRPDLGGSLVSQKVPGEVRYHPATPALRRSVLSPDRPWVPRQYGSWNQENLDSHGGWIAAAPDLAKVLASFDLGDDNPIMSETTATTMWSGPLAGAPNTLRGWFRTTLPDAAGANVEAYVHNGWVPGASCLVLRRSDGLSFVLLLNGDVPGALQTNPHGQALNAIANGIGSWPRPDLFPTVGIPSF
jgi:CubicO group peptidase (beta-lactamase class C family)